MRGDTRLLVSYGRLICQYNRLLYDEPIGLETLARAIGDLIHAYTRIAWVLLFGVGLFVAGLDHGRVGIITTIPVAAIRVIGP